MARDNRYRLSLDQDRQAACMHADGQSYRQIAETLGITDKTAKAAVQRFHSTARREERAAQDRMVAFNAWLDEGRERGWLSAIVELASK